MRLLVAGAATAAPLLGGCLAATQAARAERLAHDDGFVCVARRELASDRSFVVLPLDPARPVRQMRLIVDGTTVSVVGLAVTFGDGQVFAPEVRRDFAAGAASRTIELPDGPRSVHDLVIDYRRHAPGARVELWAR